MRAARTPARRSPEPPAPALTRVGPGGRVPTLPPSGTRLTRRYVAGHTGLVGSALLRRWGGGATVVATRAELDLTDPAAVLAWLRRQQPDEVVMAAGKVGGIAANAAAPAAFLYENLMIETSLIHGSWRAGVTRLLNFGSSCMYPKHAPQPMRTEHLMTGKLEPTSEPYALAKWAGLALCGSYNRQYGTRFITAIPCTLYGPGDNFDPQESHVLSALIRKFHEAKMRGDRELTLWGSGGVRREFLYVDDLAEACEVLLDRYESSDPINVGSGQSYGIREIAGLIAEIVGFHGRIFWDPSKPEGAPEKLLESSALRGLGWAPRTDLRAGVERTYAWFQDALRQSAPEVSTCVSS